MPKIATLIINAVRCADIRDLKHLYTIKNGTALDKNLIISPFWKSSTTNSINQS